MIFGRVGVFVAGFALAAFLIAPHAAIPKDSDNLPSESRAPSESIEGGEQVVAATLYSDDEARAEATKKRAQFDQKIISSFEQSKPSESPTQKALKMEINTLMSEAHPEVEYSIDCRSVACVVHVDGVSVEEFQACSVFPYKVNWSKPIFCPPGGRDVFFLNKEPEI